MNCTTPLQTKDFHRLFIYILRLQTVLVARDGGAAGGGVELRLAGRGEDHQDHGPVGL